MIDQIAEQGTVVIPTLTVSNAVCGRGDGPTLAADPAVSPLLDPASQAMLTIMGGNFPLGPDAAAQLGAAAASIPGLLDRRVALLAGSDAGTLGVAHGASLHQELALLVDAGLTPTQALTAATAAPAQAFNLTDRGRLHPGLLADLLLVDGDPTVVITATRAITGIWRAGTRFDREGYRRQLSTTR